jgi:hypothetical protein
VSAISIEPVMPLLKKLGSCLRAIESVFENPTIAETPKK